MTNPSPNAPSGPPESADVGGVTVLSWPAQSGALAELAERGTPRLVVVDEGSEPPVGSECCQDWMWRTGSPQEMRLRLRQLSLRALAHTHARPHLDSAGMLHAGLRSVHLTAKEQRMAAVVLERFNELVPAADLIAAAWPGRGPRRALAPRVSVLRRRLRAVGLELPGSARDGYVLRPSAAPLDADVEGAFDAELDVRGWLRP